MSARVVIVDDSLTVRMDLAEAFGESGFDVVLCSTAAEARAAFHEPPALVVLDVVLPDGDGLTLLAELRAKQGFERVRVILLSSETDVADRIRGLTQGADEYIAKPYDANYVVARAAELQRRDPAQRDDAVTILVIDDSLTYREELGEKLVEAGYRPVLTSSPKEGLRRAADVRPSAIIVDGVMPEMDGTSVVRRIRLDPGLSATPCVLLTGTEGAADEVVALDAGADAYVRKGDGTDVILARLAAVLRTAEDSRVRSRTTSLMGPKRILVIDDNVVYLEHVDRQLRDEGYEVVKATSGEAALDLLAVERVDCILLDLLIPGMSGAETCARIKASPQMRNLPLVMLTGREDPAALVEGMNAGADDFVSKSEKFEVIKARVRAQLRRKQFEDETRRVREEFLQKDAETRAARQQAEAHAALLRELEQKNRDLELLNAELQMFAYAVSHDLRQPLRAMDGFSQVLLEDYAAGLDDRGRHYLGRVRAAAQRMGELVEGLLVLSRVTRKELTHTPLRIDTLALRVVERLRDTEPERIVEVRVAEEMHAYGDPMLVESILENLLGNAWKFTTGRVPAIIDVGTTDGDVFFVRDNGAGFRMDYAHKLFAPFQRLHSDKEFPGTGMGLATTQRIIRRHGGRIWAESEPGNGAAFFFTLSADERGRGQ